MAYCIPKQQADLLKKDIASKVITPDKLYSMTPQERNDLFSRYLGGDKATADDISIRFEQEMVSKQKKTLSAWVNRQTDGVKQVKDAVEELGKKGVVDPKQYTPIARGIVEAQKGIALTDTQISDLSTLAKGIEDAKSNGLPEWANKDLFKAKAQVNQYLTNMNKDNAGLLQKTRAWSYSSYLTSPASIIKSQVYSRLNAFVGELGRRLRTRQTSGLNGDLSGEMAQSSYSIWRETGINPLKSEGGDMIGDTRMTGNNSYTDFVTKTLHGTGHAASYIKSYTDELDISSSVIARKRGIPVDQQQGYARDLMLKAADPIARSGDADALALHAQARANAEYYSYLSDKGTAVAVSKGIKGLFQKVLGKEAAQTLQPFSTVGANVVQEKIDFMGGYAIKQTASALSEIMHGGGNPEDVNEIMNGGKWAKLTNGVVAAGGATMLGYAVSNAIGDVAQNYQGIPSTAAETEQMHEKGAVPNSIKINGRWYSIGLLGPIAPIVTGVLSAKQSGSLAGAAQAVTSLAQDEPGMTVLTTYLEDLLPSGTSTNIATQAEYAASDLISDIYARAVPSIVSIAAKATDPYQRTTAGGVFDYTKEQIPGIRETLPVLKNESGTPLTTSPIAETLLSGQTSTATSDAVSNEFTRLASKGVPIDLEKPDSTTEFKALKTEIPADQYTQATNEYADQLNSALNTLISSPSYKTLPISGPSGVYTKKTAISDTKDQVLKSVATKYGYVPLSQDVPIVQDTGQ